MNKQEIENSQVFKTISSMSPRERYVALFTYTAKIEKILGVTISEAAFTYLKDLKETELALSCQKDDNTMIMAVFTPI